jgi:hypothetical protein
VTEASAGGHPAPAAASAGTLGRRRLASRLRADLRLAQRQVWRTRGSSALVLLLIALPVAGMVGGAVFWQSHIPTRAQEVTFELGRMESRIEIVGGEDPSRWQSVDSTWDWGVATDANGNPVNPEKPAPANADAVIPSGAEVFEVREFGTVRAETPDGIASLEVTTGDVWDERFAGRYHLLEGRAPTSDAEAVVTPGMLERLGARIGDELTLTDSDHSFTVTGTLRRADMRESDRQLFLPASAARFVESGGSVAWYVADWQPDLDELTEMNMAGFIAFAHDLVLDPPAGARVYEYRSDTQQAWGMVVTGSIVAAFSGYLVVLLAGAAFAVAARRQQRSLAVAASVGATRGDVFRIVVLQGTVLGLLGGVVGAAAGLGLAALVIALTDEGAVNSFWGVWGYNIPWPLVVGIAVFAVVVGTISAVAPARAATRGDVLGALRGSRRPVRLDTRRPVWGLALVVTGVALSVAGAFGTVAANARVPVVYDDPLRWISQLAIVIGPIVFQIGVLLAGHWIITLVARVVSRWGLSARIASRDAAANPSRVVPAFAAIAACVFLASFGLSAVAVSSAGNARTYYWSAPLGAGIINVWGEGAANATAAGEKALRIAEAARADDTVLVSAPASPVWDEKTNDFAEPDAPLYAVAGQPSEECTDCGGPLMLANGSFTVVAPEKLEALLQRDLPDATVDAFRDGTAIVTDRAYISPSNEVEITQWTPRSQERYYSSLTPVSERTDLTPEQIDAAVPDPDAVLSVPAQVVDGARQQNFSILLSPSAAEDLGIELAPSYVIAMFDEVQPDGVYDRMIADAENATLVDGGLSGWVERGPQPADPWLWLIAGATVALVIGAGAVCLGLARFERRPDDATLTAIGGSRGVRRRINAWQGAIIVGIGAVVGTIAGQIPMWGITQSTDYLRFWEDAPWLWLALLAVGLPLLVTAVSWLVSPRHPDLTRRTAIA